VDLSAYMGQSIRLSALNQAYGHSWQGGYWATVALVDKES